MTVLPWDGPALFFACAAVGLWARSRPVWLASLIPLACLFKETGLIFSLLLLQTPHWSRRRRVGTACAAVLGGLALRTLLAGSAFGGISFVDELHIRDNLALLSEPRLNHPIFINGGLVMAFVLASGKGALRATDISTLKILCGVFVGVMVLFGDILEYRIWLDLTPVAICGLMLGSEGAKPRTGKPPVGA